MSRAEQEDRSVQLTYHIQPRLPQDHNEVAAEPLRRKAFFKTIGAVAAKGWAKIWPWGHRTIDSLVKEQEAKTETQKAITREKDSNARATNAHAFKTMTEGLRQFKALEKDTIENLNSEYDMVGRLRKSGKEHEANIIEQEAISRYMQAMSAIHRAGGSVLADPVNIGKLLEAGKEELPDDPNIQKSIELYDGCIDNESSEDDEGDVCTSGAS